MIVNKLTKNTQIIISHIVPSIIEDHDMVAQSSNKSVIERTLSALSIWFPHILFVAIISNVTKKICQLNVMQYS